MLHISSLHVFVSVCVCGVCLCLCVSVCVAKPMNLYHTVAFNTLKPLPEW